MRDAVGNPNDPSYMTAVHYGAVNYMLAAAGIDMLKSDGATMPTSPATITGQNLNTFAYTAGEVSYLNEFPATASWEPAKPGCHFSNRTGVNVHRARGRRHDASFRVVHMAQRPLASY